jgi:hypothetical protein
MAHEIGLACPHCGRPDKVGLTEHRERCIDLATGKAMRDERLSDYALECGYCMHEWRDAPKIRLARTVLDRDRDTRA